MSEVGRHDGHSDGNLNCVALRHGWSRSFSLAPDEVNKLSYEALTRALEYHTLNLRPMMHRVFVEHPPASGTWCKVRPFKNDNSLQTVLVRAFFEQRLLDGVVTVMEIRDGADRRDEGDGLSLRSVGSRIFHPKDKAVTKKSGGWFSNLLNRVKPLPKLPLDDGPTPLGEISDDAQEPDNQKKPATFAGGLFSYLLGSAQPRAPTPPLQVTQEQEAETLRNRGWLPPGMAKRQASLRNRLSTKLKKQKKQDTLLGGKKDDNPFTDPEMAEDDQENSRDVDDFFEMERPDASGANGDGVSTTKDKAWSRFTPKRARSKGKGKAVDLKPPSPSQRQPSPAVSDIE